MAGRPNPDSGIYIVGGGDWFTSCYCGATPQFTNSAPQRVSSRPTTASQEQLHAIASQPAPVPTAESNSNSQGQTSSDPQIAVQRISLVKRTPKRDSGGNVIIVNGEPVYEDSEVAAGSQPRDSSPVDSEVNISAGAGELNIGGTLYVKVDLSIVEGPDRAAFDDRATTTKGSVPNILSSKSQADTVISADGKSMTVYVGLSAGTDGVAKGKIGTITVTATASYIDEYDSTTNRLVVPKTVTRNIRISLTNNAPNPFLKSKPF